MRCVDEVQAGDPDTPRLGRIARAAALVGLLTVAGCAPDDVGSVDRADAPDLSKISASRKSEPSSGARTQPVRPASKKPVQAVGG